MTSADRPSARDRMIAEVAANFVTPDLREIAATIDGCEAAFARAAADRSRAKLLADNARIEEQRAVVRVIKSNRKAA